MSNFEENYDFFISTAKSMKCIQNNPLLLCTEPLFLLLTSNNSFKNMQILPYSCMAWLRLGYGCFIVIEKNDLRNNNNNSDKWYKFILDTLSSYNNFHKRSYIIISEISSSRSQRKINGRIPGPFSVLLWCGVGNLVSY